MDRTRRGRSGIYGRGPCGGRSGPSFVPQPFLHPSFPAHPIFSPSLFLAHVHVHLSILMESPHPRPLREGGTEGVDNALTKGSKRAGTKQSLLLTHLKTLPATRIERVWKFGPDTLCFSPSYSLGPSVLVKLVAPRLPAAGAQASSGESPVADYPWLPPPSGPEDHALGRASKVRLTVSSKHFQGGKRARWKLSGAET